METSAEADVIKDTQWHYIMLYAVETSYSDMSLIKKDIEEFNIDIKLLANPKWIKNNVQNKHHSTLVLALDAESLKKARKGLNIFGAWGKTECFHPK